MSLKAAIATWSVQSNCVIGGEGFRAALMLRKLVFSSKELQKLEKGGGGKRKKIHYYTSNKYWSFDNNWWQCVSQRVYSLWPCGCVFKGLCLYTIFIYFFNVCMYTWSYLGNWISFTKSRFKLESDHPRLNFICQSELSFNWKRILYERQSIEQFEMELIHSNQAICSSQWWGWG